MNRLAVSVWLATALSVGCVASPHPHAPATTRPVPAPVVRDADAPKVARASRLRFGAVATVNPIATDAAMDTLRHGGNAVDAAVAAMLTLGVVDPYNSGIGGGCFMLVRMADGRTFALDGRETAPRGATSQLYGGGSDAAKRSQFGPLAVGVPGSLAVYDYATRTLGHQRLPDLLAPAAVLAERGFVVDASLVARLRSAPDIDAVRAYPASAALLVKPDGTFLTNGDVLKQPDLAQTYRAIARDGINHFYRGPFAKAVGDWMAANGGVLTAQDFADYHIAQRVPLSTTYRGHTLLGFPPPSSGGLHVAQILGMLQPFDLPAMTEAQRITTIADTMELAFADRSQWLGDPDFVDVPRGLLDPDYLRARAAGIHAGEAIAHPDPGQPSTVESFERLNQKHTTHVSVVDAQGNAVAVTATVNTTFGSKIVVPGTGVWLNNQMDDFATDAGRPNAFGLTGGTFNAVEPGKRPLSSMSPTIVLDAAGKPEFVIGAAGGPTIITQVVCVLTNLIDLHDSPEQAMAAPRFHHQWLPDTLTIERTADASVRDTLRQQFQLKEIDPIGATNLIAIDGTTVTAVSEPRLAGKAAAE